MKNKIALIILVVLLIVFGFVAYKWIKHRIEYAISDAVFVETDNLSNIAFNRVSGKIIKMYKQEGDKVKKGELLAKIDPTDYKTTLSKTEKEIENLLFEKKALEIKKDRIEKQLNIAINIAQTELNQLDLEKKAIKYQIEELKAQKEQLQRDKKRYENLVEKNLTAKRNLEEINTQLKILNAKENSLKVKLNQLDYKKKILEDNLKLNKVKLAQVKELEENIKALNKKIESLKETKKDIQNLISYTDLKAPFDAIIAKKFKSVGEVVSAGKPIYSIFPRNNLYILVLLDENKLKGVKVGSKAYITLDAYPDKKFEGEVFEINPTTAAKFALVPRDITAGEFTKVAQRIPVKIRITKGDISLLKVGLGGEVEIKRK
ncbi:HlyD family secretion protein [Hydrogenothermus marinus]|uniref:Membrane fusion protein (Multidrug efflux system) n=1 Tax=Hydrogenothermus marinus TaxID=133270 RepID=A0A3M0BJ40_9AQUI|nr:HlyD family secretion protein [Hydrogenothermus marinus]RMA97177.1 membrane fusion protein (multidrug efflux system) [Hydrogenothermus marinus]